MRKSKILWKPKPKNIDRSQLTKFIKFVNEDLNQNIPRKYNSIWNWSVNNLAEFWNKIWDFSGVIGQKGSRVLVNPDLMPGAKFFPDAMLNYAENILRKRNSNNIAVIYHYQGSKAVGKKEFDLAQNMFEKARIYWKKAIRLAPNNYIEAQNWLKITK